MKKLRISRACEIVDKFYELRTYNRQMYYLFLYVYKSHLADMPKVLSVPRRSTYKEGDPQT